jgi:hypothetical protein
MNAKETIKLAGILAIASIGVLGGFIAGTKTERTAEMHTPKWSAWSDPEIVKPNPPFPQWFIQQYRTNIETGELKARIITHGSPAGICEPETVTAN